MALKQELRNWYSNLIQAGDSHGKKFLSKWLSGSTAAAISTVVCYPLDFARTRLATDVERSSKVEIYVYIIDNIIINYYYYDIISKLWQC